jgi:hypothetical protein
VGRKPVSMLRGLVVDARRYTVVLLIGLVVVLVSAAPAFAQPSGIFGVFSQCPTRVPSVRLCTFDRLNSGEFVIGGVKVPIEKTLTLQMGFIPTGNPGNQQEYFGAPAKDGESLSKTELNVPAELLGTPLTVVPELLPGDKDRVIFNEFALASQEGEGLIIPLRLHLKNPFLGDSCYIGSESHPLQIRLTSGVTHPPSGVESRHGVRGEATTLEEEAEVMLNLEGASLVDNTFSVPGAEGCGAAPPNVSLDARVDEDLKIPSGAGENVAVLGGELNLASQEAVVASERWVPSFAPPVLGGLPVSNVTHVGATLNGTLNPGGAPDDYHFQYGTTTAYGSFEPIPENYTPTTNQTITISQPIAGLQPGTTYHYRLIAENPSGIRADGPDETFTTLPTLVPTMQTGSTSDTGVLILLPSSGIAPPAATPPASSSTPPAHRTPNAHRSAKKHTRAKRHTKHLVNTNTGRRKKHAVRHERRKGR